jgi:SAM-dependent methyltransferase
VHNESELGADSNGGSHFLTRYYPEYEAGQFSREDNSVIFYTRVQGLLRSDMSVLDFGAGAGIWVNSPSLIRQKLMRLQGSCANVVGVDPDPRILENTWLDEALVVAPNDALPFDDHSFDMVVSFAVLEHLADPEFAASEIRRVLKPGGWFCAWTPNRWGYAGIGSRVLPFRFHARLLHHLSGKELRKDEDVYPVHYRMNTFKSIRRLFPANAYDDFSYYFNGPPSYHGNSRILARLLIAYEWLMPQCLSRNLHIFIRSR